MLWVEESEKKERVYYGIQATFAQTHPINVSVYEKLYRHVGLDDKDKFNIYVVTNPIHTRTYAQCDKRKFFTPRLPNGCPYNIDFAAISAETFEDINNSY